MSNARRGSVATGSNRRQSVFEVGGDLKPEVVDDEIDREEIVRYYSSRRLKIKTDKKISDIIFKFFKSSVLIPLVKPGLLPIIFFNMIH